MYFYCLVEILHQESSEISKRHSTERLNLYGYLLNEIDYNQSPITVICVWFQFGCTGRKRVQHANPLLWSGWRMPPCLNCLFSIVNSMSITGFISLFIRLIIDSFQFEEHLDIFSTYSRISFSKCITSINYHAILQLPVSPTYSWVFLRHSGIHFM